MKPAFVPVVLLCLFAFGAAALSSQQQVIGVDASEISSLVSVSGNLSFTPFIPYRENRAQITVALSIPQNAMSTLTDGNLSVYVMLHPKRNDSRMYFRNGSAVGGAYYFTLSCDASIGDCSSQSSSSRAIDIYFNAPSQDGLSGDGIVVNASLYPLNGWQAAYPDMVINQTAYQYVESYYSQIWQVISSAQGFNGSSYGNASGNFTMPDFSALSALTGNISSLNQSIALALQAQRLVLAGNYSGASLAADSGREALAMFAATPTPVSTTTLSAFDIDSSTHNESGKDTLTSISTGLVSAFSTPPFNLLVAFGLVLTAGYGYTVYKKRKRNGGNDGFLEIS